MIISNILIQANEILLAGRRLTAIEAYQIGLVSQVFWPTSLMQEVVPRVQKMASQSAKVSKVIVYIGSLYEILYTRMYITHTSRTLH